MLEPILLCERVENVEKRIGLHTFPEVTSFHQSPAVCKQQLDASSTLPEPTPSERRPRTHGHAHAPTHSAKADPTRPPPASATMFL